MKPTIENEARVRALMDTLENLKRRQLESEASIRLLVKAALKEGITWRQMGVALGVSGQAAWERYREATPPKNRPYQA